MTALEEARAEADALEIERDDAILEIARLRRIEEGASWLLAVLDIDDPRLLEEAADYLRAAMDVPGIWP